MTEYTISYARLLLRQLGIHQEGSGGTAREESKQAEDRVAPQEAGATDGGGEEGRLHGMRAGRGDMHGRRAAQEGQLHAQGSPRRLHVHGIALQDHRVRPDHAGRGGVLPEIRLLYREGVCRAPEGRMRKVRRSPDDHRRRAAAQVEIRQGGDRAPGRRGATVSATRLPGSERDRGGVAPDEARGSWMCRTSGSAPCAATSTSGWGRPCQNLTSKGTSTERHRQARRGSCARRSGNGKRPSHDPSRI